MATQAVIEKENKEIAKQYKELLRISYQTLSNEDKKLIRQAFDVAVDAHKEQRRKSGEAYIFHPIAVAKIVASEIGLDATSIAAALLHDVVEDTPVELGEVERRFGTEVAHMVGGVTKIESLAIRKVFGAHADALMLHDRARRAGPRCRSRSPPAPPPVQNTEALPSTKVRSASRTRSRSAHCGDSRKWSIRMPLFRSQAPA